MNKIRNMVSEFKFVYFCLKKIFLFSRFFISYKLDFQKETIATVVSCFNYLLYSKKMIDSYYASLDNEYNYVLIVMDDHSMDETKYFFTREGKKWENICYFRYKKNMGLIQSWNDGIRFALKKLKASYIFLINDDVILAKNTLNRLARCIKNDRDIGIIGPLTNAPGHQPHQNIRLYYKDYKASSDMSDIQRISDLLENNTPIEIDYVNGFFIGFPISALEKNVYCDILKPYYFNPMNRNTGGEDEFQHRLKRLQLKSVIAKNIFVFHYKDITLHRFDIRSALEQEKIFRSQDEIQAQ